MSKLKIAKTGYDVTTETDARNFLFNGKNIFKIAFSGDLTISYTSGGYVDVEQSFTHGLGYVPVAFVFNKVSGAQIPEFYPAGAGVYFATTYRITNDKLYISISDYDYQEPGAISFTFRYQIMYDKII